MNKFPCTPRGELTVSPAYPCGDVPHASVPIPSSLSLVLLGVAFLAVVRKGKS